MPESSASRTEVILCWNAGMRVISTLFNTWLLHDHYSCCLAASVLHTTCRTYQLGCRGMLATGLNTSRIVRCWRTGPAPRKPRRLCCPSAYSSDALAAIKVAREEAIRQGSMFVSPQHLLVGLTAGASTAACALLQQHGVTEDALRQALESDSVIPLSSSYLQARDTDFSPESRQLLNAAAQSGTGHVEGAAVEATAEQQDGGILHFLTGRLHAAAVTCLYQRLNL